MGFFTVTWVTWVILGSCWTTFVFLCNIDFLWRDCREFIPIAFDYIKPPLSVRWLVYIVQLGSFLTECVSSKVTVCNAVTCHISLLYITYMSNAYVDTWDMLNEQFLFSCPCSKVTVYRSKWQCSFWHHHLCFLDGNQLNGFKCYRHGCGGGGWRQKKLALAFSSINSDFWAYKKLFSMSKHSEFFLPHKHPVLWQESS